MAITTKAMLINYTAQQLAEGRDFVTTGELRKLACETVGLEYDSQKHRGRFQSYFSGLYYGPPAALTYPGRGTNGRYLEKIGRSQWVLRP